MKLRINADAKAELRDSARWYESHRNGLGVEFLAEVDEGLRHVQLAPQQFARLESLPDEQSVRRYLLRRFPFALIYEIGEDEIHVLAIAHAGRKPGYWKYRK